MNRTNNGMDGFVLRRRTPNSDMARQRPSLSGANPVPGRFLIDPSKPAGISPKKIIPSLRRPAGPAVIAHELELPTPKREPLDIDLSLDDDTKPTQKSGQRAKKQKSHKKWPAKKIIVVILALLLLVGLVLGGYFVYKFLATGGKIFKGNVVTALFEKGQPLKEDANGRSNILLFGTSEDDPGHDAPNLTDSIMVVSIDQDKKDAFIVSIPRDLHVQYGRACPAGYQDKINTLYSCGKADGGEELGSKLLRDKVGEVLGLDIQYSVHVNYTVLRQAVQAVGGIRVTIESVDPRGQMDSNFDWKCGVNGNRLSRSAKEKEACPPNGHFIDYPNGPVDLDAEHALYLAQARGDGAYTYGFPRSNPDRQDNQRKILVALKDKAVSAGVLTNPVAINNLLDALGNNLRTTFEATEVKTLIDLGKDIKSENIISFSLEERDKPLATANCFAGNRCPNAGNFNYSAIQAAMVALSTGNFASLENAKIDVLNASGVPGLAQTEADKLTDKSLNVAKVGNAPEALGAQPVSFYDLSNGKKLATLKKLKELLGVEVSAGTPAGVSSNADFVVIIGKRPEPAQ